MRLPSFFMNARSRQEFFRLTALPRSPFVGPAKVWSERGQVIVEQDGPGEYGTGQVRMGPGVGVKLGAALQASLAAGFFPFVQQNDYAQVEGRDRMRVTETDRNATFLNTIVGLSVTTQGPPGRWTMKLSEVAPKLLSVMVPGIILLGGGASGRWMAVRRHGSDEWVADQPRQEDVDGSAEAAVAAMDRGDAAWFLWHPSKDFFVITDPIPWWVTGDPNYILNKTGAHITGASGAPLTA